MQRSSREVIDEFILSLGVNSALTGFIYLGDALDLMIESNTLNGQFGAMWLYNCIAEKRGVSQSTVERCLRYLIEEVFTHGNAEKLIELFPRDYFRGMARTKEFLVRLARSVPKNDLTILGK